MFNILFNYFIEIPNPEYTSDDKLYKYDEICSVGIDIWQGNPFLSLILVYY